MAMDALDAFSRDLHQAQEEWASVVGIFRDHLVGRFLDDFIAREIAALGNDVGHVVPKSVGQANFTFINTPDFEYSVRALAPFPARRHPVKWLGMRQIIGVKGRGSATVRKLAVPPHLDIACFLPGAAIDALDLLTATDGDVIASHTPHEILDVHEVSSPVVVEVLTHRRDDAGLIWTFDPDLRSLYAEQSSLTVSRFRNVLELAHAAGKPVPDEIYELALDPSRPHTALLAIRSMLMSGHPEAFVQLHRAMESGSDELRQGAQRLFDAMTMARGGSHAT
jgi:hypothetical protein